MEAGLSENLEISENYIETCMWRQNLKRSQCAAISVVLEASNGDLGRAGGLREYYHTSQYDKELSDAMRISEWNRRRIFL